MKQVLSLSVVVFLLCPPLFAASREECSAEMEGVSKEAAAKQLMVDTLLKAVRSTGRLPDKKEFVVEIASESPYSKALLNRVLKEEKGLSGLIEEAQLDNEEVFLKLRIKFSKKFAQYISERLDVPNLEEIAEYLGVSVEEIELLYGSPQGILDLARDQSPSRFSNVRKKLIAAFVAEAKERGAMPSLEQIAERLEIDRIELLVGEEGLFFKSRQELKETAIAERPKSFKKVIDTDFFDEARLEKLLEAIEKRERMIVTTAVFGQQLNREFLAALQNYAEIMDAEIIIIPENMVTHEMPKELLETPGIHVLTQKVEINRFLTLNPTPINAKQVDTLMGLDEIRTEIGESQIFGTPRIAFNTIPTVGNEYRPQYVISTGAITNAHYKAKQLIGQRTDEKAKMQHELGAVILEKTGVRPEDPFEGRGDYHWRHVQYVPLVKGFTDLGKLYTSSQVISSRPEALVIGDIHFGDADPKILEQLMELVNELKPYKLVLHDSFNGHSISKHEEKDIVSLAKRQKRGQLSLEQELSHHVASINALLAGVPTDTTLVVVPSNHNGWLHTWLKDGKFVRDPINIHVGAHLLDKWINEGEDPLVYALSNGDPAEGPLSYPKIEEPRRVLFLKPGASFKVGMAKGRGKSTGEGGLGFVELGLHGHQGANGARGSKKGMPKMAENPVYGHTHTASRWNGAVNVGTTTLSVLPYSVGGGSSWVQSVVIVSKWGERQLLPFKEHEFYREPEHPVVSPSVFFDPDFPYAHPHTQGPVNARDQWDSFTGHVR